MIGGIGMVGRSTRTPKTPDSPIEERGVGPPDANDVTLQKKSVPSGPLPWPQRSDSKAERLRRVRRRRRRGDLRPRPGARAGRRPAGLGQAAEEGGRAVGGWQPVKVLHRLPRRCRPDSDATGSDRVRFRVSRGGLSRVTRVRFPTGSTHWRVITVL
jgi:hypothetical protein